MRYLLLSICLLIGCATWAQKSNNVLKTAPFLSIIAKSGDDIPKVLEAYGLADYDCNITQFFKLNRLRDGDYRLTSGKTYMLPIQIVAYNGKSIRSTLSIDDWETAVRIRDFNDNATRRKVRTDKFTESKQLWIPWHETNCAETGSTAPPVVEARVGAKTANPSGVVTGAGKIATGEPESDANKRHFPIFGKKHAYTPLLSTRLKGKVYFLISGHGGPDPGAQGKRAGVTLCEDEYAYDVTLRLLRFLLSHGATAYMIVRDPNDGIRDDNYLKSDKDEVVWGNKAIPLNQKERLGQRTDLINALSEAHVKKGQTDQTVVEIHVDSRSVATETDVFFYYRINSEPSMQLALNMHQVFLEKYREKRGPSRQYKGTVSARDLYTLRETTTKKAVYVELANIRNDWDQQRIVLSNNRQALANWIGEALMKK